MRSDNLKEKVPETWIGEAKVSIHVSGIFSFRKATLS